MARTHEAYPPEFRRQMVELVKSGRTPSELAREYEPSAGSIRNWVAQSERDAGQRNDGMSTEELLELRRLRRENKQLRTERDILKRAAAWFARVTSRPTSRQPLRLRQFRLPHSWYSSPGGILRLLSRPYRPHYQRSAGRHGPSDGVLEAGLATARTTSRLGRAGELCAVAAGGL